MIAYAYTPSGADDPRPQHELAAARSSLKSPIETQPVSRLYRHRRSRPIGGGLVLQPGLAVVFRLRRRREAAATTFLDGDEQHLKWDFEQYKRTWRSSLTAL
jgi:hypothetical protein